MSLSKHYESNSSRPLEIIIGLILASISLIIWFAIITIIVKAPIEIPIYVSLLLLSALSFFLSQVSFRLITNKGRKGGGLLSPFAIYVGAFILFSGGLGLIILGYTTSEWRPVIGGLGSSISGIYAFKLAQKRLTKNEI